MGRKGETFFLFFWVFLLWGISEFSFADSFDYSSSSLGAQNILIRKREKAFKKAENEVESDDSIDPILEEQIKDSFFDPHYNYSEFTGRMTDRDKSLTLIKISSENKNIKFFRSGDRVTFHLARHRKRCIGYIRSVEEHFFVLYVKDISQCWGSSQYFRRGAMLVFKSEQLSVRVQEAGNFRIILLKRRRDYLKQLNGINHFVWSFDQERIKLAGEFDEKMTALKKAKQQAMDLLKKKKEDSIHLQRELSYRLDKLDHDIEYYRIDKDEPKIDRWHLDHDLGKPVEKRPTRASAF